MHYKALMLKRKALSPQFWPPAYTNVNIIIKSIYLCKAASCYENEIKQT